MRILNVFLAFLLISSSLAQNNPAILALSWLGGFCEQFRDCRYQTLNSWDHQSFTIHGYWPSAASPRTFGSFDADLISGKLLTDMKNYWPPQSRSSQRSPTFLWEHEYDTHGSDFANIYLQQHKADLSNLSTIEQDDKLQQIFFQYVVDLYLTVNVRKLAKDKYSKEEFAQAIGLKSNQFSLVCNEGSGILQEIRICFNITPKKSVLTTCSYIQARNCNNNEVVLNNWKKTSQVPVFKA